VPIAGDSSGDSGDSGEGGKRKERSSRLRSGVLGRTGWCEGGGELSRVSPAGWKSGLSADDSPVWMSRSRLEIERA
jgi:hypothetical protein